MSSLRPLPATRTDLELIQAFIQGDRSARDRVLARWAPTVLAWCKRMGGPRIDPNDAAQDVLIVILRKGATCRDADRFAGWVYGVVRKVLARHRTRAWVRYWASNVIPDAMDGAADPQVRAQLSETGRRVMQVLEALGQSHREILVLHDLEGRSAREVGELLGVPVGTVKSRVRRAREQFKKQAAIRDLRAPIEDALSGGLGQ